VTDKVVDASAIAAVAYAEQDAPVVQRRLAGHQLHAPGLLRFELASVCLKKIRTHPTLKDELIIQLRESERIRIHLHDIDHSGAVELALRMKLSIYDAAYLWLARALSVELVTLDNKLARAASVP